MVTEGCKVLVIKRRVKGKDYAVLPGGSVALGETFEEAAVRELWEETTLSAGIDRRLWRGDHNGREAKYFLMADVEGSAELSGPELDAHGAENSFELLWARPEELEQLGLHPAHLRVDLATLLDL